MIISCLAFNILFQLQHTFRFPCSISVVCFQEFDGKRRVIFVATEDGNIFAVSLPENLSKSKRYDISLVSLVLFSTHSIALTTRVNMENQIGALSCHSAK